MFLNLLLKVGVPLFLSFAKPVAQELGRWLADWIRRWRHRRQEATI